MRAVLACVLSGSAVLCGSRCAWAQAGRYFPRPPGGGRSGSYFYIPINPIGRDTDLIEVIGGIALLILAAVFLIAVGIRLGEVLGGGRKWSKPQAERKPASGRELRDLILNPFAVEAKASQTTRLMEFLAHHDPRLNPRSLRALVLDTFSRVQRCWEARDYGPVRDLLGPDLLARHEGLLGQMRQGHEINRIKGLKVEAVDFVHLFCPEGPDGQKFAVLVSFEAIGYFVDDRNGTHTRGSQRPGLFQEFWVFRRQGERWRLEDIKRPHESNLLRAANHAAGLSAEQLQNAQHSIAL
jgi:hypothetical protein